MCSHGSCQEIGRLKPIDVLPFCVLILWEWVPTLLVLIYFRHIPYTRLHRCHSCELSLHQCFVQPHSGGVGSGGALGADTPTLGEYGSMGSPAFLAGGRDETRDYERYHSVELDEESSSSHCFREDSCACCLPLFSAGLAPCCACMPCCGLAPVSAIASTFAASEASAGGSAYLTASEAALDESVSTPIVRNILQTDFPAALGGRPSQLAGAAPLVQQSAAQPPSLPANANPFFAARVNPFYSGHVAHAVPRPAWDDHSDDESLPSMLTREPHNHNAFVVGAPPGLYGARQQQPFYRPPADPNSPE